MAITRKQKEAQVKALTQKMSGAKSLIFAHYIGLTVGEVSELREKLRVANAEMKVAKKTLIKLAAKAAGLPDLSDDLLNGPVSVIMTQEDPLSGAQVAFAFSKGHDKVKLIGGVFDGKILNAAQALEFAKMPGRQQLLGIFAMMIRSPLTSFAGAISAPLTGFVRATSELAKKGGALKPA